MRSLTAETTFKNDDRFNVKSAGTDVSALKRIDYEILDWANYILVMEKMHRNIIRKLYPEIYKKKKIICLYIPDEFNYMNIRLIEILKEKVNNLFGQY